MFNLYVKNNFGMFLTIPLLFILFIASIIFKYVETVEFLIIKKLDNIIFFASLILLIISIFINLIKFIVFYFEHKNY